MNTVCALFAEALRQGRDDFNQRFTHARRSAPELDAASFSSFLLTAADPLVAAVGERHPEAVCDTVSALYDIALELACHGLLSPRYAAIAELWAAQLPVAAHLVAAAPNQVIGATTNALHHLITTPGTRPEDWSRLVGRIAPLCPDPGTFLRAGQLAAWRAGLAHFRPAALEIAEALPPEIPAAILGLPTAEAWLTAKADLRTNAWLDPAAPATGMRLAAQAGAFRGFGGLFSEPPQVAAREGQILVRTGPDCWLLTADCFGATFHRATLEEYPTTIRSDLPEGARIVNDCIEREGESLPLAEFGRITSRALTADTFAVTSEFTHAVLLIALR